MLNKEIKFENPPDFTCMGLKLAEIDFVDSHRCLANYL
jgi:hypothetical protein